MGITYIYPSNLSKKPPCPGIVFALSFVSIDLLKNDAVISPNWANTATNNVIKKSQNSGIIISGKYLSIIINNKNGDCGQTFTFSQKPIIFALQNLKVGKINEISGD